MENKDKKQEPEESRIIEITEDRVIRDESNCDEKVILNDRPIEAENAVPPKAWKNQEKAYEDEWEKNKNQMLDDEF